MINLNTGKGPQNIRPLSIGTHNGTFHADEVFATAILLISYQTISVERTRDPEVLKRKAAVLDVGEVYQPHNGRFDHHQKGGARKREDGTEYATAGLVWDSEGLFAIHRLDPSLPKAYIRSIRDRLDHEFFRHIDAVDCGVEVPGPIAFQASSMISGFNPSWDDPAADYDACFAQAVEFAAAIVRNLVREAAAMLRARDVVLQAGTTDNGHILVLETAAPWAEAVFNIRPDVLFVVFPESSGSGHWMVQVVPEELGGFRARKDLPEAWAGLRGKALDAVTGVNGCLFAHNGRFICGHTNRAGALQLARKALTA